MPAHLVRAEVGAHLAVGLVEVGLVRQEHVALGELALVGTAGGEVSGVTWDGPAFAAGMTVSDVIVAVEHEAARSGHTVLVGDTDDDAEQELRIVQALVQGELRGSIVWRNRPEGGAEAVVNAELHEPRGDRAAASAAV